MKLLLTAEAERDLDTIKPPAKEQILHTLALLKDFPKMGHEMVLTYKGFRCFVASQGRYKIIYKLFKSEIIVYYIRHSSRQTGLRIVRHD